jgi:hypothetical protein
MAKKAQIYIVKHDNKADYKVCFVTQAYKEKNAEIIAGGQLARNEHNADVKVFITDKEHKADIKILRKNFPK